MERFYLRKLIFIWICLICSKFVKSQTLSTNYIDSIVFGIDTSTYKQKTIEGTITTKPSKDKGSSSETYYLDTISKKLVKVEVAKSLHDRRKHLTFVELTTYYYNSDQLIMVRSSRFDTYGYPDFKKRLSTSTYYYDAENLISSKETGYKSGGIIYISRAKTYRDILSKKIFPANE